MNEPDALATVTRLLDATNRHDLEGIVACFAPGYTNETPAHPPRSFTGRDQVRRNWSVILSSVPDQVAAIPAAAVDGDTVWTEWRMSGTRLDGAQHEMAGVVIFTVRDDLIEAARFYLEPVERATGDADAAIDDMFLDGARP
jgi:ketosteroid isomerase-like protein